MLPKEFKDSISSIDENELEKMYVKFVHESDADDVVGFARHLFANRNVTNEELKRIQNQEKVELSSLVKLLDTVSVKPGQEPGDTGTVKDPFTILESIDEGAMGEILIAKDNELGRTVAYKVIHAHLVKNPEFLRRFYMEAQITAQLQHPNIVPVYRLISSEKGMGYAMKLIQGETLKSLIEGAKAQLDDGKDPDKYHSLGALLDHFLKVCDALHYAHRKGVVHRDLKPLNIMVGPYKEVYVMDWGIAKLVDVDKETFTDKTQRVDSEKQNESGSDSTSLGQLLGTPVYMSPEQANGFNDIVDHRSDVYTLGVILFELLTLKRAQSGKNQQHTLQKARTADLNLPIPYSNKMHIPTQLLAIVKKATQLKPEDRYKTAEEFSDDIRNYLRGKAVSARPDTLKHKFIRWVNQFQ